MSLTLYLSQDKLHALTCGESLPIRASGAPLVADISGFTELTESLYESLGVKQSAKALTMQLGTVFSVLFAEVENIVGA